MRDEFWQRIDPNNQIPIEERTYTHALADQIIANDRIRISDLDRDADAQALAQDTVSTYRIAVGIDFPAFGVRRNENGCTQIAEHGGPQYNPNDPTTFNRLYAILAGMPGQLIPLSHEYGWKDVANHRLAHYRTCNVRISRDCQSDRAFERFAIKTGEFVPIFASCTPCRAWFDLDNFDRRTTQLRSLQGLNYRGGAWRRRPTDDPQSGDDLDDPWGNW